ncbi:MAG TPA: YbaB/EbfC family nucleoid-associated protein [Candidatus Merdicola faecigallinarum]|uniref:Nucleoid-associated protein IAB70_01490 n=1 Tax=Candidatus Merdicola faecigallinarum TaxID=2840862 RepID=A0A9D1S8X2_9FIRM|nr:YbaB/EbfC family nucleoid-associated protein [Candidatus Merdicola faecigallinarum]
MAKRGGFPGGMGGFGGMNLNHLMKEAKKMQSDLEKTQSEIVAKEFEATAGGGAITVKVTGGKVLKEIKLNKEIVDPEDVEMLEDLIVSCVNEALRKVDSVTAEQMGKYNIPGLM